MSPTYFEMYQKSKKDRRLGKVCDEADIKKRQGWDLGGGCVGVPCAGRTNQVTEGMLLTL